MKKITAFLIICLVTNISYSQKKERKNYIHINLFKTVYKRNPTKNELKDFKIKGKDTLIYVKDRTKINTYISKISKLRNQYLSNKTSISRQKRRYVSIKQYRKLGNKITKNDIDNFLFREGDTLVLISNNRSFNRGVNVPYQPVDSVFLEVYKDIVYRKYHYYSNKNSNKQHYMYYWRNDIKIYFTKNVPKKVKNELKKFAKYLSNNVDSLNIKFVNKLEKSNYLIYGLTSDNDYDYDPRIKKEKIDYYIFWNGKNQIYNAKLQIDLRVDKDEKRIILISKKLFLSSLGRFALSSRLIPNKESLLSGSYSKIKKFTPYDLKILKYHYSYGICKGTNLKDFEENHKKAIELFEKTGRHLIFKHLD